MKSILNWLFTFVIAFSGTSAHSASLTFVKSTRLIFNAGTNSVSFPIKNDTHDFYLVKGSVRNVIDSKPGDINPHFLVLPEVLLLKPGHHQELRVTRISGQLPKDRESVFYVNGFFLPEKSKTNSLGLDLAVSVNIKMFYRPVEIQNPLAIRSISPCLEFSTEGNRLWVKNPSPYFVTFGSLKLGKSSLDDKQLQTMVPPFGSVEYSVKNLIKGQQKISWTLIDEFGNNTKLIEKNIWVK